MIRWLIKKNRWFLFLLSTVLSQSVFANLPLSSHQSKENSVTMDKQKANHLDITNKRLSLNFQDIEVRAVLQILAEFTGLNMVVSDTVQGSMTLHVKDVLWDDALTLILTTQGLAKRYIGSVMLIASAEEIAAYEKQFLQNSKDVQALVPLKAELIQLNYASAADIAALLNAQAGSLLGDRGSISVDTRTNNLWVQDTAAKLHEIRQLVEKLDVPVRQVLIEARIVLVDNRFEEDLGIRWGITAGSHISGTLDGANLLNAGGDRNAVPVADRLNVNLPAEPLSGATPASLGLALVNLGDDIFLDLELSALESEGRGEIISSPRLVTANQQTASIQKGAEIPFEESTSSGATSVVFKKAVLSLEVTPQITPDDNIIMTLQVNQDRPSQTLVVNGTPAIDTREIKTQVLVGNGDTLVLGGIYEQEKSKSVSRVPFLGSLPFVGYFFRSTREVDNRSELLIFITPKVIE